jgi:hypothetical protein
MVCCGNTALQHLLIVSMPMSWQTLTKENKIKIGKIVLFFDVAMSGLFNSFRVPSLVTRPKKVMAYHLLTGIC